MMTLLVVAALVLGALAVAMARSDARRLTPGVLTLFAVVFVVGVLFVLVLLGLVQLGGALTWAVPDAGHPNPDGSTSGELARTLATLTSVGVILAILWLVAVPLLSVPLLAVLLVANGVVMLRRERVRPANLLSMVVGLGILAAIAGVVIAAANELTDLMVLLVLVLLPVGAFSVLLVAFLLWQWIYARIADRAATRAQAVVVLGAGLDDDGTVTPLLASRVRRGVDVLDRLGETRALDAAGEAPASASASANAASGPDALREAPRTSPAAEGPLLVLSGGQGADEPRAEATAMAEYARTLGVAAERIVEEDRSTTTLENVRRSRELLDARGRTGDLVLVTSNYHAFRAATLLRAEGIRGHAVGAHTAGYYWPSAILREFAAILRDRRVLTTTVVALSTLPLLFIGGYALLS